MLIFVAMYVVHVFEKVNFCQAVFARFGASDLKSEMGNSIVFDVRVRLIHVTAKFCQFQELFKSFMTIT